MSPPPDREPLTTGPAPVPAAGPSSSPQTVTSPGPVLVSPSRSRPGGFDDDSALALMSGGNQAAARLISGPAQTAAAAEPGNDDTRDDVSARRAQFATMVCAAAALRLDANQQALEQWSTFVQSELTPAQVALYAEAEQERQLIERAAARGSRALGALDQRASQPDPGRRAVERRVADGTIGGGCQYCHETQNAVAQAYLSPGQADARSLLDRFSTHLELDHAVPGGFSATAPATATATAPAPAAGSSMTALQVPAGYPALEAEAAMVSQVQPVFRALGEGGFKVLPPELVDADPPLIGPQLVRRILELIERRRQDQAELAARFRSGDAGYLLPRPVLRTLLPLAAADVQAAVAAELADAESEAQVEAVLIGVSSIAALLLTVFPPTAMAGLGLGAVLAGHGLVSGYQSFEQGQELALGLGSGVLDPEQQEAADGLMVMGAVTMLLSSLQLGASVSGLASVSAVRIQRSGGLAQTAAVDAGPLRIQVEGLATSRPSATVTTVDGALVADGPIDALTMRSSLDAQLDAEWNGFLGMLEQEGAHGAVTAGEPVELLPHAWATDVRRLTGQTGQSAHGLPQSVGEGVPGYNPRAAVTTLQPRDVHSSMDAPWKAAFQQMRRQGRVTASAQEIYNEVAGALRQSLLPPGTAQTLEARLYDEMFLELGLSPATQLPLPYPNITPR